MCEIHRERGRYKETNVIYRERTDRGRYKVSSLKKGNIKDMHSKTWRQSKG